MVKPEKQKTNYCAIYCRLSQEDERTGTSGSILNQKEFLRDYVLNQGWQIYDIYQDDGISGTTFDRPGFQAMLSDIEKGKITTVIVKDLSRIGRNYLKTGYYTEEYFPKHNIRFIAVNDNVDTIREDDNELAPFKNIINEWYAKDISKKVRFSLTNQMKSLEETRTATPIYGYKFNDNGKRVLDDNTAPIVKYIFNEYINGKSTDAIAKDLKNKKIPLPGYYNYLNYNYDSAKYSIYLEEQKYEWTRHIVYKILLKEEYTGTYIRGKRTVNFKTKKSSTINEDSQYKAKDKFEAIVDQETFLLAKQLKGRRVAVESNNIFSGIVFCRGCGNRLRISSSTAKIKRLYCRNPIGKTDGAIRYEDLFNIVKSELTSMFKIILDNEESFKDYALNIQNNKSENTINELNKQIYKFKELIKDIDDKIVNLFDSYNKNEITNSIYQELMKRYSQEKTSYDNSVKSLYERLENNTEDNVDYVNESLTFIDKIKKYKNSDINTEFIIAFIDKIYVHTDEKQKGIRSRKTYVEILYNNCNDVIKEYIDNERSSTIS
ncbi:MAG: recombinase family protein [bacterium]